MGHQTRSHGSLFERCELFPYLANRGNDPFEILDSEVVQSLGGTHVPAVHTASSNTPTLFLIVSLMLAGAMSAAAAAEELLSRSPERGGIGLELQQLKPKVPSFSQQGKPLREDLLNSANWTSGCPSLSPIKTSTSAITFSEVMQKLADDMQHVDKLALFHRWWATANRSQTATDNADLFCNSKQSLTAEYR